MKKHIYETLIIIVGNFILALGICAFITPVGLITGGASGIGIAVIDRNKYFLYCVCNKYCNVCCWLFLLW